jgi:seryl-tRNA synthetase
MATPAVDPGFAVRGGLATLGPDLVRLRDALEGRFLSWAAGCGAAPMLFPPLMRVEDLDRLDYFKNFPQLPLLAAPLKTECLHEFSARGAAAPEIDGGNLANAGYALPSAACYNIYLHLTGTVLEGTRYVTTVASCFRNEQRFEDLRRLWGFTMREIVAVGTREEVQAHLVRFKGEILRFADRLGLGLTVAAGNDPFYQPQSSRALLQQLFPQKEELLYGGSLAIASLNFHRNFFGERCQIRTADGAPAFTGCVAFGVERWLHACLDRCGDAGAAAAAIAAALRDGDA